MSAEAITDAQVVEEAEPVPVAGTELATQATFAVTTPVQASDLVERLDKIKEAMNNAMEEGVDYGKIPGTDKPTLLKPGAEKLAVMFRLDVQTTHDEKWGPGDHLTVPAFTTIFDAPTGTRLGRGEGMCSTRERKYAYRNAQRICPSCAVAAIIKGKKEYGGGWVCFDKKGGCKAKFPDGAPEIESQTVGEIENPDLPDLWNTVIKMGRKRAIVDAVLLVTGASAIFTQDAEDLATAKTAEPTPQVPTYGPVAEPSQVAQGRRACAYLLDLQNPDDARVNYVLQAISKDAGGYLPASVIRGIGHAAKQAKETRPEPATPAEEEHAQEVIDEFASEFTDPVGVDHGN